MAIGAALAIGSAITGAVGGMRNRRSSSDASDAANEALQMQLGEYQKSISMLDSLQPIINEFAQTGQDNYDRYTDMMGPLEDSLQDYYMNLNPDDLAAQGNQNAQQQYQGAMDQVNSQLAAQGISNSGLSAQMGMQYGNQMAQTKAQNIMDAPEQVAQQQQGWLGYTANQGNQAFNQYASGVNAQQGQANAYSQAYNNMANAYGGVSSQNNQMAQQYSQNANNSISQGMRGVGFGLMTNK